ncbi:putative paraoxonase [Nemania sp. FL0916]|nr:putative paraoxonase [Nemania sp. FL0916]
MGFFIEREEPHPNAELWACNYTDPSLSTAQALLPITIIGLSTELHTIGFEFHEPSSTASTLFVTNNGREGPRVEQFNLDLQTLIATHRRTISHPLFRAPNSIIALSDTEFLVTNQHHFTVREFGWLLWELETYLALPIVSVVHVRILADGAIDAAVVIRQAYPNGIALLNSSTVAVAATSKRLVYLYTILPEEQGQTHPRLRLETSISLPFLPDNLSVSKGDGALLIAGHPHLPSLNKFSRSRWVCHEPKVLANAAEKTKKMCEETTAASWVSEWTLEGGLKHLYAGWEYPTSSSIVRDREKGVGIVSGLYGKGLMVWRD